MFNQILEVCFIILAAGLVIRHFATLDFIKEYTFTVLGVIGLIYVAFAGSFDNCLTFIIMWFFTVCAAAFIETQFSSQWS